MFADYFTVAVRTGGQPVRVVLEANCRNGRLMQFIAQYVRVESQTYTDATARIRATMPADRLEQLAAFGEDVRVVSKKR